MATDAPRSRFLLAVAALTASLAVGCVKSTEAHPVGVSDAVPEEDVKVPEKHEAKPKVPDDVVLKSRLPFHIVKTDGNQDLSAKEFFDELSTRDLICIGEDHDNPHHHWAELYIVQELAQRAVSSGRELGLGLEMFQTPFQKVLDDYANDKITRSEMLKDSEYEERWGFPFAYYRHQIDHVLARGGSLVALNADRELSRRVAKEGIASLEPKEVERLGQIDLDNAEHRARFDALMKEHPDTGASKENMYAAQVLWDETMASTAAEWLGESYPARQLVVLAGSAHCHESAIPSRVERRIDVDAVSVRPIISNDGDQASQLEGYDYGFLMEGADAHSRAVGE